MFKRFTDDFYAVQADDNKKPLMLQRYEHGGAQFVRVCTLPSALTLDNVENYVLRGQIHIVEEMMRQGQTFKPEILLIVFVEASLEGAKSDNQLALLLFDVAKGLYEFAQDKHNEFIHLDETNPERRLHQMFVQICEDLLDRVDKCCQYDH